MSIHKHAHLSPVFQDKAYVGTLIKASPFKISTPTAAFDLKAGVRQTAIMATDYRTYRQ